MWCLPSSEFHPNLAFLQPCCSIILSDMFAWAFQTHRRIQTLNYISIITSRMSAAAALTPLAPLISGLLPPQTALGPPRRLHLMVIGRMSGLRCSRPAADLHLGWAAPHAHRSCGSLFPPGDGRQSRHTADCHTPNYLTGLQTLLIFSPD